MATTSQPAVDVSALRHFLDGEHAAVRERMRELLCEPRFARVEGLDRRQYRDQVFEWLRALAEEGGVARGFPSRYGGDDNVGGSIAGFETLALTTCRCWSSAGCSTACSAVQCCTWEPRCTTSATCVTSAHSSWRAASP